MHDFFVLYIAIKDMSSSMYDIIMNSCNVVLTFESVDKIPKCDLTIHMKVLEQYSDVVVFVFHKMKSTF